jgi:hypothetical protein
VKSPWHDVRVRQAALWRSTQTINQALALGGHNTGNIVPEFRLLLETAGARSMIQLRPETAG